MNLAIRRVAATPVLVAVVAGETPEFGSAHPRTVSIRTSFALFLISALPFRTSAFSGVLNI